MHTGIYRLDLMAQMVRCYFVHWIRVLFVTNTTTYRVASPVVSITKLSDVTQDWTRSIK